MLIVLLLALALLLQVADTRENRCPKEAPQCTSSTGEVSHRHHLLPPGSWNGMGKVDFTITTKPKGTLRRSSNQGVAQIYGFWVVEAESQSGR